MGDKVDAIKTFLQNINEEFLILISNKGIYKRVLKDFEAGVQIRITIRDEIVAEFSDGTICTIRDDSKKSICSCPSFNVCKHLVFSYFYLNKHYNCIFEEIPEKTRFSPEVIVQIDKKALVNKLGVGKYNELLLRMSYGSTFSYSESNVLESRLQDESIFLQIDPNEPFSKSVCSCKSGGFCLHMAEVIVRYQIMTGHKKIEDFPLQPGPPVDLEILKSINGLLEEILVTGLARLPEGIIKRIELQAVWVASKNIPALSKSLNSLASLLKDNFKRKATFSVSGLRSAMEKIFIQCRQLQYGKDEALKLDLQSFRSAYISIPSIEIIGLGSSAWQTKSGFCGVTGYFLDIEKKQIYTYTQSRGHLNVESLEEMKQIYAETRPWDLSLSMGCVTTSRVQLNHPAINRQGRLSSQSKTSLTRLSATSPMDIVNTGALFSDWKDLISCKRDIFIRKGNDGTDNVVVMQISRWGDSHFDRISQTFNQTIFDIKNRKIQIRITYSTFQKKVIENLEIHEKKQNRSKILLARLYLDDGHFCVYPLILFDDEKIKSLTLDDLHD